MPKPKLQPVSPTPEEDFDLTTPEERRWSTIRKRLLIGGVVALLLIAVIWFAQAPVRHAIKRWQSRRLAGESIALTDKGEWENATNKARDALQLDKAEPEAWRAIGHLLSRTGQNLPALEWWIKVDQAGRLTPTDRREFAASAIAGGEVARAAKQLEVLLAPPNQPAPGDIMLRANLKQRRGELVDALNDAQSVLRNAGITVFEKLSAATLVLSLTRSDSEPYLNAWKAIETVAQLPGEIAALDALSLLARQPPPTVPPKAGSVELPEQLATAPTTLTRQQIADLIEHHPQTHDGMRILALRMRAEADSAQAGKLLNEAVQKYAGGDDATLIALNTWLYQAKHFEQMLQVTPLERATKQRELFLQRLDALGALGRHNEVADLLSKEVFRLDPVSQHMYLAVAREQLGEKAAAEIEWQRALEAADDVDRCLALGEFATRAGALPVADNSYAKAVKGAPGVRAPYDARLKVLRTLGKSGEAQALLHRMNHLWPGDERTILSERYVDLLRGTDNAEAESAAHEAEAMIKKEPYNWEARATLALARMKLGQPKPALEAFRGIKAVAGVPQGPLAVRAVVLEANGYKDGARGDARTLSSTPLLPEERALIAPLLAP